MTPSERERRIKAAARAFYAPVNPTTWVAPTVLTRNIAAALDAADKAVPIVSEADRDSLKLELEGERHCHRKDNEYLLGRMERAEAAARDFADALRGIQRAKTTRGIGPFASPAVKQAVHEVLGRHPSFSGEEGTGT